jgi:hypothetical protein
MRSQNKTARQKHNSGKKYKHTHLWNSLPSHLLLEIFHHLFNIRVDKDGNDGTHHRERNYPESGHSMAVGFDAGAGAHNHGEEGHTGHQNGCSWTTWA